MTDRLADYPAAHSMDTAWFAIDRDGKVAYFETGEAGAIPTDAVMEEGAAWAAKDALPVRGGERLVLPGADFEHAGPHRFEPYPGATAVVFLRDEAPVAAELATGRAVRVEAEGALAIRITDADQAFLDRLHAAGACLGCAWADAPEDEQADDEDAIRRPAPRGLYAYTHATDNWIAGPYVLEAKPAAPLRAEQLPEEVREAAVRFDGSFDEAPAIQPMNVWPSEAWGAAWLDQDGKTVRPVPGREDDYPEDVEGLRDDPAYVVEGLPADAPRAGKPGPAAKKPAKPWWKLW